MTNAESLEYPRVIQREFIHLFSQVGMLTVDISKKGDIDGILSYFDEGVPPFLADLIRDFPGRHYWSDRVLLHQLRQEKVMPEDIFRVEMKSSRVTVFEV